MSSSRRRSRSTAVRAPRVPATKPARAGLTERPLAGDSLPVLPRPLYTAGQLLTLARRIMQPPAAPYYEHFVQQEITRFVQERAGLELGFDAHGNLLIRYENRHRLQAQQAGHWVLTAHLDHPGFAVRRALPRNRVELEMLGGVGREYFAGAKIALYSLDRPARQAPLKATVREARTRKDARGRVRVHTVIAQLARPLAPGLKLDARWFGMWDLPAVERRGDQLCGRVMDDLAVVVCALALLDLLNRRRPAVRVDVLLTRAEEVGLCGMLAATRGRGLPKNAWYLNLECSNYLGRAEQGAGPVIRVGDLLSTFDPEITGALVEVARPSIAAGKLKLQRKLMDGGTCEATALCAAGFRTGAACLAVRHYHNQGPRNKIAPETVSIRDALMLVDLFWLLVTAPGGAPAALRLHRERLDRIFRHYVQESDARLRRSRPLFR